MKPGNKKSAKRLMCTLFALMFFGASVLGSPMLSKPARAEEALSSIVEPIPAEELLSEETAAEAESEAEEETAQEEEEAALGASRRNLGDGYLYLHPARTDLVGCAHGRHCL